MREVSFVVSGFGEARLRCVGSEELRSIHREARTCRSLQMAARWPRALEPAALECRPAQSRHNVGATAHDVPDQAGTVVLDHEDDWALVDPEMAGRDPPARRTVRHRVRLVERRLETVAIRCT